MNHPALAAAALLLLLVASACGSGDGAVSAGPAPQAPATRETPPTATEAAPAPTQPAPATEASTGTVTYEVWFSRPQIEGRNTPDPRLFAVHRRQEATVAVGAAALEALLRGPTDAEEEGDLASNVPAGTRVLGLDIADGLATVDLSAEFESGGGSLSMQMRLAQVVYTLTQFATVDRVRFRLDGRPVDVFSGEGIVLDEPVGRADYAELLPAILVTEPAVWAEIDNPITVRGTADVFEANVTVRLLRADGTELASTFTTATCGTGCRGDFETTLGYPAQKAGTTGILVLSDDDAAGQGFPPHSVRIPVFFG